MRIKSKTLYLILNIVKNLMALTIIIAMFSLISPSTAEAAIAVDAISTNTGTGSSITVSHTTSGENRLILVGISAMALNSDYESGIPRTISSVKYNDVDLTLVGSQQDVWGEKIWIYRLKAPDTETHNLVVTFTETSTGGTVVGVMTFTGVDQTTPLGTFVSAYDDDPSTPATVNVSSASGELVFDAVFVYDAAITVGADQTQRWNLFSADDTRGGGSTEPGAASVTMSWSHAGDDSWCIGAVPIKPVSTPPTPTTPTLIRIFDNAIINTYSSSYECNVSVVSTDPDDDDIQYEIQWDTDPGLGSASSKTIGPYASGVAALTTIPAAAETIYYWRTQAEAQRTDWYNTDWLYRKKITIDNTKVPNTDQTNFPVLINRTDTDWKVTGSGGHVDQSDGGDILFTSSDGTTKLDHEIEEYDSLTGELIAWVEVDNVSSSTDTDIYIYYGNATVANQWNVSETWDEGGDNNFKAVWHLNETSGAYGGDGTTREFSNIYTDWTSWFEITNDPNAPGAWTWSDVQGLDIKVRGVDPASHDERCFKIEIRVTYTTGTVTYYFDGYDAGQAWPEYPSYMVDGDEGTEAFTDWSIPQDVTQLCNSNTCPGTDLGTITNVEIRAKIDVFGVGRLYLTPIFPTGGPGAIKDATQYGNHGTDGGSPTFGAAGKIGNAISFDGNSDYITIPSSTSLRPANITINVWTKANPSTSDEYCTIIGHPYDDEASWDAPYFSWLINRDVSNTGGQYMITTAGGEDSPEGTPAVWDDTWHMVTLVYDGVTIQAYVDAQSGPSEVASPGGNIDYDASNPNVMIGMRSVDASPFDEYYGGLIDEVRVSNTARDADWIQTEYNNQNSPSTFYSVTGEVGYLSSWSEVRSFTMDMDIEDEYPYWYQVAGPQFEQGTKNGVETYGSDQVRLAQSGTVTFAAITKDPSSSARSSASFSHTTPAGNNRLLIVTTGLEGDNSVSTASYGGNSLTKAIRVGSGASGGCSMDIWYLVNPPTGSNTVSVTFAMSEDPSYVCAMSYNGVNQSSPIGATAGNYSNTGTDVTVNITTTTADALIVGGAEGHGGDTAPYAPGSEVTERYDFDTGGTSYTDAGCWGGEKAAATATEYTFNATQNASDDWAIAAVEVKPAATTEGTLTSPAIVFADLFTESSDNRNDWDGVKWTKSSDADDIKIKIEWLNGGSWELVPDGVIPGNPTGLSCGAAFCSFDISSMDENTYDTLRIKAFFTKTAKSADDPALEMWALGKHGGITGVSPIDKPMIFALYRNRPNPFTNRTEIRYQIPKRVKVELQVFDVIGRSVVTLVNKEQGPGYYSIHWKGMNKNKKLLPSGVYFLRMEAGDFKATQKMVRLR